MTNELLSLSNKFMSFLAKFMDMDFYLIMCSSYMFDTLGYWMNYV